MRDYGLCVIISDPVIPYKRVAEICVSEEVRYLQLREKHISDREFLGIADELSRITRGSRTTFVVNDRPEIARMVKADGFHVGQDDLPIDRIREWIPKSYMTGLSTHSLKQLKTALKLRPDYVGFGPVFKTPTKEIPDPVVGLDSLAQALCISKIPVFAIGGINMKNIQSVLDAGARNICMVRELMHSENLAGKIRQIKGVIEVYWRDKNAPLQYEV